MKKILKIFIIILISTTLFACGKKENNNTNNSAKNSTESTKGIELSEKPFETFNFQTIDIISGEIVKSENIYSEKDITFINVWATFCGPCKKEMPDLQKLYENYSDKVNFIGIVADTNANMDANVDEALSIIKDSGVKYTNIMPNPTMEDDLNKIAGLPTSFFVDKDGNVIGGFIGAYSYEDLSYTIENLIAENK